jgi:hypothetical protein
MMDRYISNSLSKRRILIGSNCSYIAYELVFILLISMIQARFGIVGIESL